MSIEPATSNPEETLHGASALLAGGRIDTLIATVRENVTLLNDGAVSELAAEALKLRALAEGLAFALTAEADQRGIIAGSTAAGATQWVRDRAAHGEVTVPLGVRKAMADVVEAARIPGMAPLTVAVSRGEIGVTNAAVVTREFRIIRRSVDPECHDVALEAFVEHCAGDISPRKLGELCDAVICQYGIAETFDDECARRRQRRSVGAFRRTPEGTYKATVELDPDSHAVVEAALTALSAPTPSADGHRDLRSAPMRRADALVEMSSVIATNPDLLSRSEHAPDNAQPGRAAKARVVVTIPWTWLKAQANGVGERGYARTAFDQPLSPETARQMACDGQIIPLVLGSESQPLDVGRASRLATPAQRIALAERDRGCTFPGCDRPPSWCQAHHLHEWETGGRSDMSNFALLCTRHHTVVHRDHLVGVVEPGPPGERGTRVTWHPPRPQRAAA